MKNKTKQWIINGAVISMCVWVAEIIWFMINGSIPVESISISGTQFLISRTWDFLLTPVFLYGMYLLYLSIETMDKEMELHKSWIWFFGLFITILVVMFMKWGIPVGFFIIVNIVAFGIVGIFTVTGFLILLFLALTSDSWQKFIKASGW